MAPIYRDWSLQRKGPADQARHQERVHEAIRQNLPDLITEDAIVTSDGRAIVKVPIRSMKEYHFRFHPKQGEHAGQGEGDTPLGKVLGQDGSRRAGSGKQAGDGEGMDYFEAEVSVDELAELLFAELELPYLEDKPVHNLDSTRFRYSDIRKKGLMANLDKRRTVLQNIRRNAQSGEPHFGGIHNEDLRFHSWDEQKDTHSNAAVIAMRDVSGSMGEFKKLMSRTMLFWMLRFLRSRYDDVAVVLIAHHIEAREVDEQSFFHLGESGGTRVSSAYELALKIVQERFPSNVWNTYAFHFSDGDNWGDADNHRCNELVAQLLTQSNLFGYGEINEGGYVSPLMSSFQTIRHPRFVPALISRRQDIYPALRKFFPPRQVNGRVG